MNLIEECGIIDGGSKALDNTRAANGATAHGEDSDQSQEFACVAGYNRGIKVGNTIYIAGATARLTNGQIVGDGKDYALEVRTCLDNNRKVVEDGGGKVSDVVRLTGFMTDINFGAETGKAIQEAFPGMKPTVTGIVITSLGNAVKNAHVEIEATAVIEKSKKRSRRKK